MSQRTNANLPTKRLMGVTRAGNNRPKLDRHRISQGRGTPWDLSERSSMIRFAAANRPTRARLAESQTKRTATLIADRAHNACAQRPAEWARLLPKAKGVNTRAVRCSSWLGRHETNECRKSAGIERRHGTNIKATKMNGPSTQTWPKRIDAAEYPEPKHPNTWIASPCHQLPTDAIRSNLEVGSARPRTRCVINPKHDLRSS